MSEKTRAKYANKTIIAPPPFSARGGKAKTVTGPLLSGGASDRFLGPSRGNGKPAEPLILQSEVPLGFETRIKELEAKIATLIPKLESFEAQVPEFRRNFEDLEDRLSDLESRFLSMEENCRKFRCRCCNHDYI